MKPLPMHAITSIATSSTDGNTVEIAASSQNIVTTEVAGSGKTAEIYPLKARYEDGTIEFDPESFQYT